MRKRFWALVIFVLGVAVLAYGISRSSAFQTCQARHDQYSAYQQDQEGPLALKWIWRNAKVRVRCGLEFVEANHGPLTALATIALAIFTTTLWLATRKLVRHGPQIERAYISAGGFRRFLPQPVAPDSREVRMIDTRRFEFHVNNYGKTPGTIFQIGWGFCETTAVPNVEPVYQLKYFDTLLGSCIGFLQPSATANPYDRPIPATLTSERKTNLAPTR